MLYMAIHTDRPSWFAISIAFKFQIQFVMFIRGHLGTPIDPAPVLLSGIHSSTSHICESGTPSGLRGTLNELGCGKVTFFLKSWKICWESNQSRNIHFSLINEVELCAIFSLHEHQYDPEQVAWNFAWDSKKYEKSHFDREMAWNGLNGNSRWICNIEKT